MKRAGFRRMHVDRVPHDPDRVRSTPAPSSAFRLAVPVDGQVRDQAKPEPLQHRAYMALVRMLPCARCGRAPLSQFCHADQDKGQGVKTDCRLGFPGCDNCHRLLGSSGEIPREHRRLLEADYGRVTRELIRKAGHWPRDLSNWVEK